MVKRRSDEGRNICCERSEESGVRSGEDGERFRLREKLRDSIIIFNETYAILYCASRFFFIYCELCLNVLIKIFY